MKNKIKNSLFFLMLVASITGCKKDYLIRYPEDNFTDQGFWQNENQVRTFAWGFYTSYFVGYNSGFSWGPYFTGQSLNDDFAPSSPAQFTQVVPTSGGGWGFTLIRKANLFISRIPNADMSDEAKNHWLGVARFFRAMEYGDMVQSFGDVPYYGKVLVETDPDLYKKRDPRELVMDSVLADFRFAAENVRTSDPNSGPNGLVVNKWVVLAFMSRYMLFEGTWQKYHENNTAKANQYLEAAKWAANEIMTKGSFALHVNYRDIFSSLDLAGNKETILYRKYETGQVMHSLESYSNVEPQTGMSRNAVESYLASDGLPINLSPLYKGDTSMSSVLANRDGRMPETLVPEFRIMGHPQYSTSGYSQLKFLNRTHNLNTPEAKSSINITDAPIIRLGEVLLNYAEASYELGQLTQTDLDKSINLLRKRAGTSILQVIGNQPAVNGVIYDDPVRDQTVPSLLWEIRRERRMELMFEGFRLDDLKRWKKLVYADTKLNPTINRGAHIIDKNKYKGAQDVVLDSEGYIIPAAKSTLDRIILDRNYLSPLPLDQIKLYTDNGAVLEQNPGWINP